MGLDQHRAQITAEWSIPPETVGTILSADLLGLLFGYLFLAPLSARFGAKSVSLDEFFPIAVRLCDALAEVHGHGAVIGSVAICWPSTAWP